jgi:hypothetical protein
MLARPCVCPLGLVVGLALGAVGPGLSGCSYNPARPAAGWVAHDSRNVRVYSSTFIEHEYAQEWLENAYHAYANSFFKDLKLRPLEAMFLQVVPGSTGRIYRPNDDPPASWALEGMPGGGRIGKDGLIVLTERRDFRGASRQVAYQLIGQAIPNAPLWLRIGFGQYLSEYRILYQGNRWSVCYGTQHGFLAPSYFAAEGGMNARPQTVRAVPGRDVLIPLADVLDADWYEYARHSRYWFNYTAYAFVSFLIHGRDAWHASRFAVLLQALEQGKSTAEALTLAYPHLLPDELDEALSNYVRAPRRGTSWQQLHDGLCFAIPPGTHAAKKAAQSPVDEGDVQAALDDLKRLPLWRDYGSWYPTEVLVAESGILEHTPVKSGSEKSGSLRPAASRPGTDQPVDQRQDPARR